MKLKTVGYIWIVLLLVTWCCRAAHGEDGYFLPCKQKANLVWNGYVQGADDGWYDIRLVPGYAPPVRYAWRNIKEAGSDLGEYVGTDKYSDLWDNSGDCLEWAFDDCLADFAIKGSGRAWKKYFRRARNRVDRRVFGWWLSYPWAFMQSTVDNVVRVPLGLVGTAIGTASGVAVVPAYHLVDSSVKAVWDGGVEGVALPAVGLAWNTVAAPPLSLLGQQPSEERVDGFWVRKLGGNEVLPAPDKKEVKALAQWGAALVDELKPFDEERRVATSNHNERVKALRKQLSQAYKDSGETQKEIGKRETAALKRFLAGAEQATLVVGVTDAGWTPSRIREREDQLRRELAALGLSSSEVNRAWSLLRRHCPSREIVPVGFEQSTDPVRTSIKAIKDID